MPIDELTRFFAWFTLLNLGLMLISWLIFIGIKETAIRFHILTMGIGREELLRLHFQFFSIHTVLTLTFGLIPYLVVRFGFSAG